MLFLLLLILQCFHPAEAYYYYCPACYGGYPYAYGGYGYNGRRALNLEKFCDAECNKEEHLAEPHELCVTHCCEECTKQCEEEGKNEHHYHHHIRNDFTKQLKHAWRNEQR